MTDMEAMTLFQWVILSLSALCIGMSKTGVQGMMLLIVPYMAMAFGAKESTGVILPMLCMADIIAVAYYKRIADWKVHQCMVLPCRQPIEGPLADLCLA